MRRLTKWLGALALLVLLPSISAAQVETRVVPGPFQRPLTGCGGGLACGGGAYVAVSGPDVQDPYTGIPLYRGTLTFTLRRHYGYEDLALSDIDTSLVVIYTVDGTPVSSRLTHPYSFTWDSTTVADGPHTLSMIIVDGAGDITLDIPVSGVYEVDNVPGAITGAQTLQAVGSGFIRTIEQNALSEGIPIGAGYVRAHPVTPSAPFIATVAPPAHSRADPNFGLTSSWVFEPITKRFTSIEETPIEIRRTKGGHRIIESNIPEVAASSDLSLNGVLAKALIDGPRNDNDVSPYSNYTPDPTSRGFVGIDLAGRVFRVGIDGTVTTIAGRQINRDIIPYSDKDVNVSEADRLAWQVNTIGTFVGGVGFSQPNDLAFDPRNSNILYVADTKNHRIAKVDFSAATPVISTYAGDPNNEGDTDGPATGGALFFEPTGLTVKADGTVYVADYENPQIRVIAPDGGAVSTISSAALDQPHAIKLDSNNKLIIAELTLGAVKRLDPGTGAVTVISAQACGSPWVWIDVDRRGNLGPVDDIFLVCDLGGSNAIGTRISSDGSRAGPVPMAYGGGHYPWVVSIDDDEARIVMHGFGDSAPQFYHLFTPGVDQGVPAGYFDEMNNRIRNALDVWGTVPEFPANNHPAFTALRGQGTSFYPALIPSYDDLATLSTSDIGVYIQGGMGGGYPRPEFTGRDLQLAIFHIQTHSALFPNQLFPTLPAPPVDVTPPVISNVAVIPIDGFTAQVTWDTNEPTLGYVRFASSTFYHRFSSVETSFGTSHSVTLFHLPENKLIHFAVVTEDLASNMTMTLDHTFTSGTGPGVLLNASPTSITAGDSSTLTWSSTSATSCAGTGFPTGAATSGSVGVSPTVTTAYTLTCTGAGGSSNTSVTVTVTGVVPVPTAFISASPSTIASGNSSTLTWSSTNATSCAGTGFSTSTATAGTLSVSPTVNTTYSVICTGTGGTSPSAGALVTVTATVPLPTAFLSAFPSTITEGNSSTLTWSSTNATSCAGTGFSTGTATAGTLGVSPVVNTTYSIICTGAGGDSPSAAALLTVHPIPLIGLHNGGFETPIQAVSGYSYQPAGGVWDFGPMSGVQANGSAWDAGTAPEGTQTAFVQGFNGVNGVMSQTFTQPTAGTYVLNFKSSVRYGGALGLQTFVVSVDGTPVGTFSPTVTSFTDYATSQFSLSADVHTIAFTGTGTGNDVSDFIDSVSLTPVQIVRVKGRRKR